MIPAGVEVYVALAPIDLLHVIMKKTGHRSVDIVNRYIRDARLFDHYAAAAMMFDAVAKLSSKFSSCTRSRR